MRPDPRKLNSSAVKNVNGKVIKNFTRSEKQQCRIV